MTAIDVPDDLLYGKPARKPGDFQRNHMGAPIVAHPTETTKAGKPRRVVYGRPSSFGTALDNAYNLVKWKERQLLIGAGILIDGPGFPELDPDDRDALDQLAAHCHKAAGSSLAADRGIYVHLLLEWCDHHIDNGSLGIDDPLILAGVALGIPDQLQFRIMDKWWDFRDALGVTAIGIEQTVVHDHWRLAGTLDRHDLTERNILTGFGIIAAGTTFIGDIKTGSLTLGRDGQPNYWVKYPVQLAAYADGVPYDVETDERGEWSEEPNPDIAIIYHYDLARAIDGELVDWQAIPVSLQAGREGGDLCRQAADFAKRRDLFLMPAPTQEEPCSDTTSPASTETFRATMSSLSSPVATTSAVTTTAVTVTSTSSPNPNTTTSLETQPSSEPVDAFTIAATGTHVNGERPVTITSSRTQLRDRLTELIAAGHEPVIRRMWPDGVPPLSRDGHTVEQLTALFYMVRRVETEVSWPFDPAPKIAAGWVIRHADGKHVGPFYEQRDAERYAKPSDEIVRVNEHGIVIDYGPQFDEGDVTPDDGDEVPASSLEALRKRMQALPADRQAQIAAIAAEAHAAGRSISVQAKPCVRRWEIARALVRWAEVSGDEDDFALALVGSLADFYTNKSLGDTIGGWVSSLTIEQARELHDAFDCQTAPA